MGCRGPISLNCLPPLFPRMRWTRDCEVARRGPQKQNWLPEASHFPLAYRKGNIRQNTCLIRGCFEVRIGIVLRGVPGSVTSGGTKSPRTMANSHISKGLRLRATWGGTAGTGLNSDPSCPDSQFLALGQRTSATASWTKVQFFVLGGE